MRTHQMKSSRAGALKSGFSDDNPKHKVPNVLTLHFYRKHKVYTHHLVLNFKSQELEKVIKLQTNKLWLIEIFVTIDVGNLRHYVVV